MCPKRSSKKQLACLRQPRQNRSKCPLCQCRVLRQEVAFLSLLRLGECGSDCITPLTQSLVYLPDNKALGNRQHNIRPTKSCFRIRLPWDVMCRTHPVSAQNRGRPNLPMWIIRCGGELMPLRSLSKTHTKVYQDVAPFHNQASVKPGFLSGYTRNFNVRIVVQMKTPCLSPYPGHHAPFRSPS